MEYGPIPTVVFAATVKLYVVSSSKFETDTNVSSDVR